MKAALYARVSTEEQATRYGLAAQLADLRALAAKQGYTIPAGGEFVDDGHSGAMLDRPALNRLREAVRAGAFQRVLVSDPDRLARKLTLQLLLVDEIERQGVGVEFATTPREDTADSRLLFNVRGVIAEFEREKIRERTMRGRREKLRAGRLILSTPPFGYRLVEDRLVPLEEEAGIVRMMYGWLVEERRPIRSIASELQALGVPTRRRGPWRISAVRKILVNPVYCGAATYTAAGETFTIATPPLVADGVWAAAQAQLKRNADTLRGRPPKRFYLLAGLVRCGACGRRMTGAPYSYDCTNRDRVLGNGCRTRVKRGRLDTLIWETLVSVLRDPHHLAAHVQRRADRLGVREIEARSTAEHWRRQHGDLSAQEDRLLALWGAADLPDDTKAKIRARLTEIARQRQAVAERLARAEREAASIDADQAQQEAVERACQQARRGLARLSRSPERRRGLLRTLVNAVVIRGDRIDIEGVLPSPEGAENVHATTAPW